jgi:hypothetical protein
MGLGITVATHAGRIPLYMSLLDLSLLVNLPTCAYGSRRGIVWGTRVLYNGSSSLAFSCCLWRRLEAAFLRVCVVDLSLSVRL